MKNEKCLLNPKCIDVIRNNHAVSFWDLLLSQCFGIAVKWICMCIRGVNRSPKISDLQKCPNPIRTSVGYPTFSWTIFGQAISHIKYHAFSTPYGLMEHNLMNDIALCVSLCTSVIAREQLACREQVINVMINDTHLDNFWTSEHFGHFLDNIFG